MNEEHFQQAMDKALGDTGVDSLEANIRAAFIEVRDKAREIFSQGYRAGFEAGSNEPKSINFVSCATLRGMEAENNTPA